MPVRLPLLSPTILGWLLPGRAVEAGLVRFGPDGHTIFVEFGAEPCDHVATARADAGPDGTLRVNLRLTGCPMPTSGLYATFFATAIRLAVPVDPAHPPRVVDGLTANPVDVLPYAQ